ncbi:hypothetical protein KL906_002562 [Ogataea polymorpha]|nr:hypothetical protein KL906_002562 [Ogataea polymorpha]KAG7916199.1 hypothetical protein KL927_003664 [Ogataea polymorpha]
MVQLFVVHPDLQVSNCDDCPSKESLGKKKDAYVNSYRLYNKLIRQLCSNPEVTELPNWCLTKNAEHNVRRILEHARDEDVSVDPETINELDAIDNMDDLKLSSFKVNDADFSSQSSLKEKTLSLIQRLDLPDDLDKDLTNQKTNSFLAFKYLQIVMDLSLIEYKYLQIYSRINTAIKKYFSSPELTLDMEEEGCRIVSTQMDFFKKLEVLLKELSSVKAEFEKKILLPRKDALQLVQGYSSSQKQEVVE